MEKYYPKRMVVAIFLVTFICVPCIAQINSIGGFEGALPSYWTKGAEPGGSTLTWSSDVFRSMGRSLKITKAATSEAAVWASENMCDFWSPQHSKDVDIKVGAYVKTEGVNTDPATDDEKWYVSYAFYDSAGALIGETKLDIDQSVASSNGFVADTNGVGATILPKDSWTTIIKFVGGKDATGTVWADDFMFYGRGGAWAGQNWNTSVGVPTGWIYWLPPIGGNDGELSKGFENTIVTTEESHSGLHSLKFDLPFDRDPQDAWVGTRRFLFGDGMGGGLSKSNSFDISNLSNVSPGDVLRISVWVKGSNLVPDSAAAYPVTWAVGFTYGFWKGNGNNDGWNTCAGGDPVDTQFILPSATAFDWRQFNLDVTVPTDPACRAMSVRLHPYSRFTGMVYFDDLTVEKLEIPQLTSEVGGFEGALPSYWTKGAEPGGSTLTWSSDVFRSMGRSLKITKAATSEAAVWASENMCDFWSPQHSKDVDIKVGAYVKTEGVNTDPATDDEKWYVSYAFYDSAGALIGETKLDIDQSVASSNGFVADTNGVGATILPKDSWTTIIKFVGGKDATGTVWADDFMFYGRGGAWAGQNWNTSVGVPTGWIYWLPPIGGNDGELSKGFENTIVTTEESHSGLHSLKFDLPFDRDPQDAWVGTRRFLFGDGMGGGLSKSNSFDISNLSNVSPGDVLRISVWVKGSNLVPDSAAAYPVTWAVGFTYGFWKGNGNNDGWNTCAGGDPVDTQFILPSATAFDWRQFNLDVTVPADPACRAMSVRLHPYSRFTGTVYFDDLTVEKLEIPQLTSEVGGFEGALPSYWTKGAEPGGSTLTWSSDVFRSMGRSLKITKAATSEAAVWASENMCDFWSPQHSKDVDIKVGAYVKTEGVNTDPATDDEKWYVSYAFYDSAGALIGETKLDIDQSVASSNGFVADTNGVGATILPKDSWTTIIKFVGGKDATGTVWADDFMFYGRGGAWAGQNWNTSVGVPTGWIYWLPPIGGNDGELSKGFENTIVTTEESHSGLHSLKFDLPFDRDPQDAWVGTRRFLFGDGMGGGLSKSNSFDISNLSNVSPGDVLRISVWVKGSNLVPDSAAAYPVTWAVGFTYGFWKGNGNNDGWNTCAGGDPVDTQFILPSATAFDWRQFNLDVTVPADPACRAMSVRLHPYSRFTGMVYFDDLTVEKIGSPTSVDDRVTDGLPKTFELANNYPNPFNPTTTIGYGVPRNGHVVIEIFDILGKRVRKLLDEQHTAGRYSVIWNARDDFGQIVGSGIYFYRIKSESIVLTKKLTLLK